MDSNKNLSTAIFTDWGKCLICQKITSENLRCPANGEGSGYTNLAENLRGFENVGCLPDTIQLDRLDEGDGIEETFSRQKAVFHDSCRLKFSKSKLKRAEKRKSQDSENLCTPQKFTRKSPGKLTNSEVCFLFEKQSNDTLHEVSTFQLDNRVRHIAIKVQDERLLAKLSVGDLMAQEAKYHAKCLATLYNSTREKDTENDGDGINHGLAFAEIVSYIEETRKNSKVTPVFKMTDIANMYSKRLNELGTKVTGRIHTTRLKNRLLNYLPDMQEHKQGRDIVLISNQDIAAALEKACEHDAYTDAMHVVKAAEVIRRDIFKMRNNSFDSSFSENCQNESVPKILVSLVDMILNGSRFHPTATMDKYKQPTLSIAQLLMFNSSARHRSNNISEFHHNKVRETPLPIYLGMMIHTKTRKRELVDTLFNLGLSISYNRVLEISTNVGNAVCTHYQELNSVCPPQLNTGLFTTAAVNNIDHNPSSTTALDSLHGTAISLHQHQTDDNKGTLQEVKASDETTATNRKLLLLPESYTNVHPMEMYRTDPAVPLLDGPNKADCLLIPQAIELEKRWLEHVAEVVASSSDITDNVLITWASYNSSLNRNNAVLDTRKSLSALLPLFQDQTKSVAMMHHAMNVIKRAVGILNPSQIPVFTVDQPLFALAKHIQWTWPVTHGEDQFVVIFGGLHIEMAALKVVGNLLESSGWTSALIQANVASSGMADSFLKASHITRTRRAHQVTLCALYILMQKAYTTYCEEEENESDLTFNEWTISRSKDSPMFHFWMLIMQLQQAVMIFLRSLRESDFQLYVESLSKIKPWFFSLDHGNYARWISVHLRDMVTLEDKHPDIYAEFKRGNFTVKKTQRQFSAMAIDQAHEQFNALVKGDGGAVGLTENPSALQRWMVCGPEMARAVGEFETCVGLKTKEEQKTP